MTDREQPVKPHVERGHPLNHPVERGPLGQVQTTPTRQIVRPRRLRRQTTTAVRLRLPRTRQGPFSSGFVVDDCHKCCYQRRGLFSGSGSLLVLAADFDEPDEALVNLDEVQKRIDAARIMLCTMVEKGEAGEA